MAKCASVRALPIRQNVDVSVMWNSVTPPATADLPLSPHMLGLIGTTSHCGVAHADAAPASRAPWLLHRSRARPRHPWIRWAGARTMPGWRSCGGEGCRSRAAGGGMPASRISMP